MHKEEKIINNVLHYRSSPDSEWIPYTPEQLTTKLKETREKLARIKGMVDSIL